MSSFHSVVTEQKVFICSVCAFIERLLQAVLPDIAWDNTFLLSEERLGTLLDDVIRKHSLKGENEGDCCIAMAQTACNAMKHVCDLLKMACSAVGLKDVAGRYLDGFWFVKLLMNKNTAMLNRLLYTIDFTDDKPSRILMNVAAILNGREEGYDAMNANAKRKATNDTKKIIDEVQKLATGVERKIDESKAEIVAHVEDVVEKVDAVDAKIDRLKIKGKRKSKYSDSQREACYSYWKAARKNAELKFSSGKGVTRETAYEYYRRELAESGITSSRQFIAILHTIRNKEYNARIKALEAKIEAARKKKSVVSRQSLVVSGGDQATNDQRLTTKDPSTLNSQPSAKKSGIIRGMKSRAINRMLATALSIFAVAAPCMASAGVSHAFRGSPSSQSGVAASYARPERWNGGKVEWWNGGKVEWYFSTSALFHFSTSALFNPSTSALFNPSTSAQN